MQRIGGAALLNDMIHAVHLVMPRTAVPVVISNEVKDAGALNIETDISVRSELIEEMGRISGLIASPSIVSAAHVRANSDSLIGPVIPHPVSVQAHRNSGIMRGSSRHGASKQYDERGN